MKYYTFVLLALVATSSDAVGSLDDFEGYAVGGFPSPDWLDVGLANPDPPNPPDPSAVIAVTNDPFGSPTQVLSIVDALAPSQGIYRSINVSPQYTVSADVRVDRFCDVPTPALDWAMEVAVGKLIPGMDPCCGAQCGIYAESFTQSWHVYVAGTNSGFLIDIDLGLGIDLGRWYRVALDLDAVNGVVHSRISDAASGTVLVDQSDVVKGWTANEGLYDIVDFFDGELTPENTVSNLAVIDNVQFCCETTGVPAEAPPSTWVGLRVYPNPMRAGGVVQWTNENRAAVSLKLYDPLGHLVLTRDLGGRDAGVQQLRWSNVLGSSQLPSGTYFLELEGASKQQPAVRVTLIR